MPRGEKAKATWPLRAATLKRLAVIRRWSGNAASGKLVWKQLKASVPLQPRKFNRGICCGGHLAILYIWRRDILHLHIFHSYAHKIILLLAWVTFLHGFKSHMNSKHARIRNDVVMTMCIDPAKSEGTVTQLHTWRAIWLPPHSINRGVQKGPDSILF